MKKLLVALSVAVLGCAGIESGDPTPTPSPVSFASEVVPGFTSVGCTVGLCHGTLNAGQLELGRSCLEDFAEVASEYRLDTSDGVGPRVLPAARGASSFFIVKAMSETAVPHDAGKQLYASDLEYERWVAWIDQGMINDCPEPREP